MIFYSLWYTFFSTSLFFFTSCHICLVFTLSVLVWMYSSPAGTLIVSDCLPRILVIIFSSVFSYFFQGFSLPFELCRNVFRVLQCIEFECLLLFVSNLIVLWSENVVWHILDFHKCFMHVGERVFTS